MAIYSTWAVASFALASSATVTIGGTDRTIPAGSWYLRDEDSAQSLIDKLQTEIAAVVAGSTVRVLRNRKVHIDFNGSSPTLAIPSSLAEVLGFTSSPYAGATSRTAENVSRLLWSPGWPETASKSPSGNPGRKVYDRVMTASASGLSFDVTVHSSTTLLDLSWQAVRQERAWTSAEGPGEFVDFFDRVIVTGDRFRLYADVLEDDASSAEVTWTTARGPYVVPDPDYDWYRRFVATSDSLGANIEIRAMKTSDF